MASINISELRPAGSELFQDSESFLNELGDREMAMVSGGLLFTKVVNKKQTIVDNYSIQIQSNVGNSYNANTYGNFNTVAL
ncbi:MAG: hypothetical protein ACRDEA_21100 [Microcystaceae cyanobacterium]